MEYRWLSAGGKTFGKKERITPGGGGGGVLLGILGGSVPPGSSNPDPISDLNMPDLIIMHQCRTKVDARSKSKLE